MDVRHLIAAAGAVVALGAAGIAACSPFGGSDANANAITGSVDGGPVGDGGAMDAAACVPGPNAYCDGFDEGGLSPAWLISGPDAGSGQVDPAVSFSAPSSFVARLVRGSTACRSYSIDTYLGTSVTTASRAQYQLYFGGAQEFEKRSIVSAQSITWKANGDQGACAILVYVDPGGTTTIAEQVYKNSVGNSTTAGHALTRHLLPGQWHGVMVDWDLANGMLRATIDGESISEPLQTACPAAAGAMKFSFGSLCVDSNVNDLVDRFDDVALSVR